MYITTFPNLILLYTCHQNQKYQVSFKIHFNHLSNNP